ncbi:MAG: DUF4105 domain-containing protein [Deltaproteobacteria bacterium]|nr:DUF4105 domain-containing protein [Myxococcales bacterium]MDP3219832.1 DUF4105 domain-containing protein [Deltaproteobacteria bacterium]
MALARRPLIALGLAALALPAAAGAQTHDEPEVALVTMGPGDDVFSRYGHAALCVRDEISPQGRCYNYGTADFTTYESLLWAVLRGKARFWVSVVDEPATMQQYARIEDRTVWRQVLPYPAEARRRLVARLALDALPEHRYYVYHHYRDNCTTRIRDHLDAVSEGSLSTARAVSTPRTWRERTLEGLASDARLLALAELLLGRPLDATMNRWEEMFLPAVLREEVQRASGVAPVAVSTRVRPVPPGEPGYGIGVLAALSGALALLGLGAGQRRSRALSLAARGLLVTALTLLGALVWGMAAASALPELHANLMVLVLTPTDLALAWSASWSRYAPARLVGLVLVLAAWTVGAVSQVAVGVVAVGALLAIGAFARADESLPQSW